jgi:S-adenosylmethionine:tRNA ribosyltransferase-isomerase
MLVSDYNYNLPEERIAKFPPKERGSTRLLVLNRQTGDIKDSFYRNLDEFLNPGDLLILNDTRVMQSRLFCKLPDGRERELVVLEKHGDEPQRVMYRGKLHEGELLTVLNHDKNLVITKILGNGIAEVESDMPLAELAEQYGTVPLPPYLHRDATNDDKKRYQTVWAKHMGSAAAPTASLNMTEDLLKRLQDKGVVIKYLTCWTRHIFANSF